MPKPQTPEVEKNQETMDKMRKAFTGTKVPVPGHADIEVTVHQLAFRHIHTFIDVCAKLAGEFAGIFDAVLSMDWQKNDDGNFDIEVDQIKQIFQSISGKAFEELRMLLDMHCDIDLNDISVPAELAPVLMTVFVRETLASGKLQSWGKLAQELNRVMDDGPPALPDSNTSSSQPG